MSENEQAIIRTERGWAGHFCAAHDCNFRRNTLLERGETRIVVSTVGNFSPRAEGRLRKQEQWIGYERFYETMAFLAEKRGQYWEADIRQQLSFRSPWSIEILEEDTDLAADAMHETVVVEFTERLTNGEQFVPGGLEP